MHYELDKKQVVCEKEITQTAHYAEVPFQEKHLSLYLHESVAVNGETKTAGQISLPLFVGFNRFHIGEEKLTVLRRASEENLMCEHYRPQFHYTVPMSLLNDPNGLVFDAEKGIYHLYFQYQANHVDGNECKSWGHCQSPDLIRWKTMPHAIYPDRFGEAYSGSCVIDEENTSGLFDESTPPLSRIVAFYTSFDGVEKQCLAYSKDGGITFEKYNNNPVIDNVKNGKQKYTLGFRDPKVIRLKSTAYPNGIWLMTVAGEQARLFTSHNLLNWTLNDEFVYPNGEKIVSECPDFFPMKTQNGQEKWVFIGNDYNNGNSRIFYVVGDLQEQDGKFRFIAQTDGNNSLNLNPEAYASQTFYNDVKNRKIMIAWLRDWVLFDGTMWKFEKPDLFSKYWLGTFSLPQELELVEKDGAYQMYTHPVDELKTLRTKTLFSAKGSISCPCTLSEERLTEIVFCAKNENIKKPFSLLIKGGENEEIRISYNAKTRLFQVDKSKSLGVSVPVYSYTVTPSSIFSLRLLADTSVLDIYVNDGEKALSTQFYFKDYPRFILDFEGKTEYVNAYTLQKSVHLEY